MRTMVPEALRGLRAEGMIAPDLRGVVLVGHDGTPADVYVSDGRATPWYGRFSYTSFCYVEVMGLREPPAVDNLTGLVIHTDLRREGQFTSTNKLLEEIHTAASRTARMLIHAVPNDNAGAERGAHGIALSLNHDFLASIGEIVPLTRKFMRDLLLFEGYAGLPSIPTTRRQLSGGEATKRRLTTGLARLVWGPSRYEYDFRTFRGSRSAPSGHPHGPRT